LHCDNVTMEFSGQDTSLFKGSKNGRIYLTSHRMIFNSKKDNEMKSFSAPFILMSDVTLEQPVFSANYIKGKVRAQPNGNFIGEVKFKLHFKSGGAIEYGQALLRAAGTAQSNMRNSGFSDDPPPYTPSGNWHEAPPPAYQPPPGYYGWIPQHDAFSGPAPNTVFVSDNPPPYPGIGGPPAYVPPPNQGAPPPQHFQPASVYMPQQVTPAAVYNPSNQQQPQTQQPAQNTEEISWNGFSVPPPENETPQPTQRAPEYNQPPAYNQGYGAPGYPPAGGPGYPPASAPGYPPASAPGYPPSYPPASAPGYPTGSQPYPPPGYPSYPSGSQPYPPPGGAPAGAAAGAFGFSAPPAMF